MPLVIPRLYAIIDPVQSGGRSPLEVAESLLQAGIGLIQFRHKGASSGELWACAAQLAKKIHDQDVVFIVDDRPDVARSVDADGVHVGQEDLPVECARRAIGLGKWVGCSTHSLEQVREAEGTSADYLAFGPVFPTASKKNPDAIVGLAGLRAARQTTRKALVGIGGITVQNARAVIEAGADSVAVISGLVGAPDIVKRAEEFLEILTLP